jgi:Icc-related predicted phosphoesterase
MKITVTSDLHGILPKINPTELLIICGDISPLHIQNNVPAMQNWLKGTFKKWIDEAPCDKVIMVPGNHDYILYHMQSDEEKSDFERIFFCKLKCLWNEFYEYEGLRIFGTPYCKIFGTWSFMALPDRLTDYFNKINPNLDILITHDPVYNLGDTDLAHGEHHGNVQLRQRLDELDEGCKGLPKYCFSGHFHEGDHTLSEWKGMKYANTSLVNERYLEAYSPLELEI